MKHDRASQSWIKFILKSILIIFLLSISMLCYAFSYFSIDLYLYANPVPKLYSVEKAVMIHPKQPFNQTIETLYGAGIIQHPFKFRLLAQLKGCEKTTRAGEYLLSPSMSPVEVLDILTKGSVILYKMTIPEGFTILQIASVVENQGLGTEKDFITCATNSSLAKEMGIDAETCEGYLFPDTYFFPKNTSCEKIILAMVKRFWTMFTPELKIQAKKMGLFVHQAVTLASIIEKESGTYAELPVISSVFHNRLKKNMRLESDPTVIYDIKDFDGNITRKHLRTQTPHNTYMINGLPPGPIANPGIQSIRAALYPSDTNYYFFVSKKDKTHQFSTNFQEHINAVKTYQLRSEK